MALVVGLEDRLQADAHTVSVAIGEHSAFNVRWIETHLTRALISDAATLVGEKRFRTHDLGNGGVELVHLLGGVERRFRLRRGQRDAYGVLQVMSNSDSILTDAARAVDATLFDGDSTPPARYEQWVLAYRLHPVTRTFVEVKAGRVVGFLTQRPPYRLRLADVVNVPFLAPTPPSFPGNRDDLDLGDEDEDEGRGDVTG